MTRLFAPALGTALLLCAALCASAQTPGSRGRGEDYFNLGPIGAAGMPLDKRAAAGAGLGKVTAIRIESVTQGTPASDHLRKGDYILGAGGRPFTAKTDPLILLSQAIEAAEGGKKNVLKLLIQRDEKPETVSIRVRAMGKHSRTCPLKCKKCAIIVGEGLEFLKKSQGGDGSWKAGPGGQNAQVVVTTLSGLAFMA
ncbi:MAG: DUF6288 domain-containing protein, partial [Planctomycetota bacterium]